MAGPDPRAATGPGPGGGTGPALEQQVTFDSLYALRAAVVAHAADLGADEVTLAHIVIIAGELAANAVRHGGGHGTLRLWAAGDDLFCEVTDGGSGLADPNAGRRLPSTATSGGRGLWIVRQLADRFDVRTGADGTRITVAVPLTVPGA